MAAAPPFGRRCAKCGREHGPGYWYTLGQMEDPNLFGPCHYAFCTTKGTHALQVCMVLNNRCTTCLYRGHQKNGRCGWVVANLEIFENLANHGYVTSNRNRDLGASNGFYPIIRLAQLHHIAINGGYERLLSLNEHDGRELVKDADNQHNRWVGAEPWATQVIVENAFKQARAREAHSAVQNKDHMAGTQLLATRIKILLRRETSAETERLAKACNKLQTNILHRVELQQLSGKGFLLATGLVFGIDK
jgi:hypothetical protein